MERVKTLIVRAFPGEFAGLPFYVLLASAVPDNALGTLIGCHGYSAETLDLQLKEYLPWAGRGPCVVINDRSIRADYGDVAAPVAIAGSVVHEATHIMVEGWLPGYRPEAPEPDPVYVQFTKIVFRAVLEKPATELSTLALRHDFDRHGPDWLRVMLHLRHRVLKQGLYLPLNRPFQQSYHSNILWYDAVLASECLAMEAATAAEILATPAPEKFLEQFEEDELEFRVFLAVHVARQILEKEHMSMFGMTKNLSKLVDTLGERLGRRKAETARSFTELCIQLADGKSPAIEAVEEVLLSANKTADDLRDGVAKVLHRRELSKIAGERAAIEGQLAALEKKEAEKTSAFEAVKQTLVRDITAILGQKSELAERLRKVEQARDELVADTDDGQLETALAPLTTARQKLRGRLDELRQEVSQIEVRMDEKREQAIQEEKDGARGRFFVPDSEYAKRAIAKAVAPLMDDLNRNGDERLSTQAALRDLDRKVEETRKAFVPSVD